MKISGKLLLFFMSIHACVFGQTSESVNHKMFNGVWKRSAPDSSICLCQTPMFKLDDSTITLKVFKLNRVRLDDPQDGIYRLLCKWKGDSLMVAFTYHYWTAFAVVKQNRLWTLCDGKTSATTQLEDIAILEYYSGLISEDFREPLEAEIEWIKKISAPRPVYHYHRDQSRSIKIHTK